MFSYWFKELSDLLLTFLIVRGIFDELAYVFVLRGGDLFRASKQLIIVFDLL